MTLLMALPINLLIGTAEQDGRPVLPPHGVDPETLDGLQKQVLELGHKIMPAYHPLMEPTVVDGRHILILRAPGGQGRPYKAPESLSKASKAYCYYIRKGASTVRANHHDEIELMSMAAQIPYDDRMNQQSTLLDLKLPLILAFLRDVGSVLAEESDRVNFEEMCRRMAIVDGPAEHVLPRNVGLMFFHEQPERFFPKTQIDIVQFPDGLGGNGIIERTFKGSLNRQLRDALLYLSNTILEETIIKNPNRAEADRFFNYPYAAIEEILVNAVYHRSYELREPIEVRILPTQMTITSFPGPDRSISLADLSKGKLVARRYRNRGIGEFLKELRLTEGRRTGIPKVIRAMSENGSPNPEFDTDADRTYFTAMLPIHASAIKPAQVTPQVTPQAMGKANSAWADKMRAILQYCTSPRDRVSILARLRLKDANNLSQRYLLPAIDSGWLTMTDPEHPSSPVQRYRTTPDGAAFLDGGDKEEA